jgi:hypothetical protein
MTPDPAVGHAFRITEDRPGSAANIAGSVLALSFPAYPVTSLRFQFPSIFNT